MKLYAALGVSLAYGADTALPALSATWTKAFEIAEDLDDIDYQLRSLWGLWFTSWTSGRHRVALALAQKFCALAANRSDCERWPGRPTTNRRLTAVLGGADRCPASSRGHARSLCPASPDVAHRPFPGRPASRCVHFPGPSPVAARFPGAGAAHRRAERGRRLREPSCDVDGLRPGARGMPDCPMVRRPPSYRELRWNAERSFNQASTGTLARFWSLPSGRARRQARPGREWASAAAFRLR